MLRDFFSYYRPFMGLFWLDFGCAVLSGLLELAFPVAITGFIDHLLPQGNWTLTMLAAAGLLAEHLPAAQHLPAEGGYIAWVDLRAYDLGDDPAGFLREHAGVALTDGRECGTAGAGHVRINTATPRAILVEIVERTAEAITGRAGAARPAPAAPTR